MARARLWLARLGRLDALALVGLGLYLGRVAAEALPGARRPWEALLLAVAGLVLAWLASAAPRRWAWPLRPLALAWVYALWPVASVTAAWAVGLATVTVWLWALPGRRLPRLALEGGLLLAGLALYGATVAPTVLPADSGEFALVAAVLGIAHPPGYPLYTLLGKLATLLPLGEVALRLNLLSVLFGAMTLAGVAICVRAASQGGASRAAATDEPIGAASRSPSDGRSVGTAPGACMRTHVCAGHPRIPAHGGHSARTSAWGGALAALSLAFSPTFWSQATTANIRSLTALFTALGLLLLARWGQKPTPGRLAAFALAFGLAVGHHSSLALLALPVAAYVLIVEPRLLLSPRRWLPALGAFLGSFAVLLYLPLRSAMGPAFDPVPVDSLARFFEHVLATGFRGDMLYFVTLPQLLERARIYLQIVQLQFGPVLPWAMALALAWVLRANWRLGLLLGGVWLVNTASALTYRAPQTVEYLLPSYVAMCACLGCGLALGLGRLPRWGSAALLACLSIAIAWNGLAAWPEFRALHQDRDAREYAEAILHQAPPDALVLANWHWATPLWYLQQIEGLRPDVSVEYVYPEGARSNEAVWLARIAEGLAPAEGAPRSVIVTNRFHAYEVAPYSFEPLGGAWLVRPEPPDAPPADARPVALALGGQVRVEAYRPDAETIPPGDTLRVTLYWRPLVALERDYAVFVQLVGPQGAVGQADRAQPTSSYAAGALRLDEYELPLLLQTPPGVYSLIAGFYTPVKGGWERLETDEGADHVVLGSVEVLSSDRQAATTRPLEFRYMAGVRLRGMDVDRGVAGQARLYLHWAAEAALAGPLQVLALADGQPLASAMLPPLARGQTATLALDLPSGADKVQLRVEDAHQATVRTRGPWGLPWRSEVTLRLPHGASRYVPLGGELVYLSLDGDPGLARAGEPASVRPRFMALRPLLRDYSVSVGLVSADASWERKDDGTPAMGAIPTLKWLTGWTVAGPYAPAPPPDAASGAAQVTLSVYDAFTLAPLAVLDERLASEGQGVFLIVGSVEIQAR